MSESSSSSISHRLLTRWIQWCRLYCGWVLVGLIICAGVSGWLATHLTLNTNQLEMMKNADRQVADIKRVTDMIGGAGQLTLALRGENPKELKKMVDALVVELKEHFASDLRRIRQRMPTEFLIQNAALFMETEDLKELKKRVMAKIKDAQKRADPFFFEIEPTPPIELKVDDLLAKYQKVGKKRVADEYYLSADQKMILIQLKPMWDSNLLEKTGSLVDRITQHLTRFKLTLDTQTTLSLIEDYSPELSSTPHQIEFGFTGTYQTNFDDSYQMKRSLIPVSLVAFIGVFCVLFFFFGRHPFALFLILSGLVLGLVITFGWTALTVGELNMITSILGGILMGLGIDFGIHFLYRLREELELRTSLEEALVYTLSGAGWASIISGLGTIAAFVALLTSDFKGFSQFGFLAGSGVFFIGLCIYIWAPALLLWMGRKDPQRIMRWLGPHKKKPAKTPLSPSSPTQDDALPAPHLWIGIAGGLALLLCTFAPSVPFEYNTRALMVDNQPSVLLQDEIKDRFQLASDPVAIYTPTLQEAKDVYQALKIRQKKGLLPTVDTVVGLSTFVPPQAQQSRNFEILQQWKKELSGIKVSSLPPDLQERWTEGLKYLNVHPYTLQHLPKIYSELFTHLPSAQPENHGYLTFVYAGVDLWDGKNMLQFASELDTIKVKDQEYHSAGMPILFSIVAQTIIRDGKWTVGMTFILLIVILLVDFRRFGDMCIALLPLGLGMGAMLGIMSLLKAHLNLMNLVVFPIILGYGVSHGVYLLHRFREGASPRHALFSVGRAVMCSTLTTLAGWSALLIASHKGLQSMGILACAGMGSTLLISLTLMPAILEYMRPKPLTQKPSFDSSESTSDFSHSS